MAITLSDLDNDDLLSLQETMVVLYKYFTISSEKALQVDCNACV